MTNLAKLQIWAVIQGEYERPTTCQPIPITTKDKWHGSYNVLDGTAYGIDEYEEVRSFSMCLYDDKTLLIAPKDGTQVIYLKEYALDLVCDEMRQFPGLVFAIRDSYILIGYGKPFATINTKDAVASCNPDIYFPLGRMHTQPFQRQRGQYFPWLRPQTEWSPPDISELEDLSPLAEFIANLRYTPEERDRNLYLCELQKLQKRAEISEKMDKVTFDPTLQFPRDIECDVHPKRELIK